MVVPRELRPILSIVLLRKNLLDFSPKLVPTCGGSSLGINHCWKRRQPNVNSVDSYSRDSLHLPLQLVLNLYYLCTFNKSCIAYNLPLELEKVSNLPSMTKKSPPNQSIWKPLRKNSCLALRNGFLRTFTSANRYFSQQRRVKQERVSCIDLRGSFFSRTKLHREFRSSNLYLYRERSACRFTSCARKWNNLKFITARSPVNGGEGNFRKNWAKEHKEQRDTWKRLDLPVEISVKRGEQGAGRDTRCRVTTAV